MRSFQFYAFYQLHYLHVPPLLHDFVLPLLGLFEHSLLPLAVSGLDRLAALCDL